MDVGAIMNMIISLNRMSYDSCACNLTIYMICFSLPTLWLILVTPWPCRAPLTSLSAVPLSLQCKDVHRRA
ncbi:hypothetical protein BJ165DRAFT_1515244 [Panaeolus papilionaceus]|nr:hypothetical protein BJ165DRAFT_1515244 [Panaeolus papilionaceus]